jgi:hypothetical protein
MHDAHAPLADDLTEHRASPTEVEGVAIDDLRHDGRQSIAAVGTVPRPAFLDDASTSRADGHAPAYAKVAPSGDGWEELRLQ